jgi:hypothetical protein
MDSTLPPLSAIELKVPPASQHLNETACWEAAIYLMFSRRQQHLYPEEAGLAQSKLWHNKTPQPTTRENNHGAESATCIPTRQHVERLLFILCSAGNNNTCTLLLEKRGLLKATWGETNSNSNDQQMTTNHTWGETNSNNQQMTTNHNQQWERTTTELTVPTTSQWDSMLRGGYLSCVQQATTTLCPASWASRACIKQSVVKQMPLSLLEET